MTSDTLVGVMARNLTTDELVQLEMLLDAVGTYNLIDALGNICMDKGGHIRETYQDVPLAKHWEKQSRMMDTFTTKLCRELPGVVT